MPQDRDFVIDLDGRPGSYQLHVFSPVGEHSADVKLDPAELAVDLDALQARVLASAATSRAAVPELEWPLRHLGQALFEAVFPPGKARELLLSSRNEVERAEDTLRIVLRLRPPELARLPWELLFSDDYGYLCRRCPMVRYVYAAERVSPLKVTLPLRVLGMTALPGGLAALDADAEQQRLQDLLAPLQRARLVKLDWVAGQHWKAAQQALYAGCHVFHFIGHGGFDPDRGEGVIAFADERGRRQLHSASELAELFSLARPGPRLVVLNSCKTAAGNSADVFSSAAATLVRRVPAVVAMQFAVTDTAAADFALEFYTALVNDRGVDEAVRAGRIALIGSHTDTLEWVTPVLYLRSHDSHLFHLTQPGRAAVDPGGQRQPPRETAQPSAKEPQAQTQRPPGQARLLNFNLPSLDERSFVDRLDELETCRQELTDGGFLVIHGPDGLGKTTLAQVYAAKYQYHYDVLWLVPSSHEFGVRAALEQLDTELLLATTPERDLSERLIAILAKLSAWNRWLLIFDDVTAWNSIQDYIPQLVRLKGHIIATTQSTDWTQNIHDRMPRYLPLNRFRRIASLKYLKDHICGANDTGTKQLALALGDLPYALEIAAFTLASKASIEPHDIATIAGDAAAGNDSHVNDAIQQSWHHAINQLQNTSPFAHSLLQFCSLFAADPIPDEILTYLPSGKNKPLHELRSALTNPSRYSDLVNALQGFPLVKRASREAQPGCYDITVHKLLQEHIRDKMPAERRRDLLAVAIDLLLDIFHQSWFHEKFRLCALALPHAEACLNVAARHGIALREASTLMVRMAHYHRTRGRIFKSRDLHERALRVREKAFGKDSPEVARSLINLGIVLTAMGKPREAIKCQQRSLEIVTRFEPPDEELIAICRDDLGLAWTASGQYTKAIDLHKQAYDFWVNVKKEKRHSNVAKALDNMGRALYLLADLTQAEKVLEQAAEIGQEALDTGFDKLDIAEMLHNLGQVLRARGGVYDAWRAKFKLEQALRWRSEKLEDRHPSVIETHTELARVLRCLGEYDLAAREVQRARQAIDEIRRYNTLGLGPLGSPDLSSKYLCAALIAEGELRFALREYAGARHSLLRAQELAQQLAEMSTPLPRVEHAELMENLGRVCNAESSSSTAEYWIKEAEKDRLWLNKARAHMPKIPEEVYR